LIPTPIPWMLVNVLVPYYFGETLSFLPPIDNEIKTLLRLSFSPDDTFLNKANSALKLDGDLSNPAEWNRWYNLSMGGSFGGITSGSALASISAVFANKGTGPNGARLFKESTWREASVCSEKVLDAGLGMTTSFARAGFSCHVLGQNWFGWGGWGGSLLAWREPEGVAVGYAMNRMGYHLSQDPRLLRFIASVDASLGK